MTTTDDALTEQIARGLDPYAWEKRDEWGDPAHVNYGKRDHVVATSLNAARAIAPIVAAEVRKGQAEALRRAAHEFAEGAWADQWEADRVDDDVTAVQSTERWFRARADTIEKEADQ